MKKSKNLKSSNNNGKIIRKCFVCGNFSETCKRVLQYYNITKKRFIWECDKCLKS